jgi:Ran GTPase-activating protein (RanGAP) involved in mRNA processing and transport
MLNMPKGGCGLDNGGWGSAPGGLPPIVPGIPVLAIRDRLIQFKQDLQHKCQVLERFGRFPHRNIVLGRKNSADETSWLCSKKIRKKYSSELSGCPLPEVVVSSKAPTENTVTTSSGARILVLHGNKMSVHDFKRKTKPLLKNLGELTFVEAPHVYGNGEVGNVYDKLKKQSYRCWWHTCSNAANAGMQSTDSEDDMLNLRYVGLEDSIAYLEKYFELMGPFDGILGFSQGGALAAILASMQEQGKLRHIRFRFVICISAFYCRDTRPEYYQLHLSSNPSEHRVETVVPRSGPERVQLPSFHVYGEQDEMVESWRSVLLAKAFRGAVVAPHGSGHYSKAVSQWPVREIAAWVQNNMGESKDAAGVTEMCGAPHSHHKPLDCFREKFKATVTRYRLQHSVHPSIMMEPMGLQTQHLTLLQSSFWQKLTSVLPIEYAHEVTQGEVREFVQTATATVDRASWSNGLVDDMILLAWCVFPFNPLKKNRYSAGGVFYWILRELLAELQQQQDPSPHAHVLAFHLPFLTEQGNWDALVRLDLLIATGSSLREIEKVTAPVSATDTTSSNGNGTRTDAAAQCMIAELFAKQLVSDHATVCAVGLNAHLDECSYSQLASARLDLISKGLAPPSNCAFAAPRRKSYPDKATRLPERIAAWLMEMQHIEAFPEASPFASARYQQVVSSLVAFLRACSPDNLNKTKAEQHSNRFWMNMPESDWQALLKSPLSSAIRNPEPEPVDVSSEQQLAPLHEFLRSGQSIASMGIGVGEVSGISAGIGSNSMGAWPELPKTGGAVNNRDGITEISFERGTLCSDGRLDLCKQVIGPPGITALIDSLRRTTLVEHILLGNNIAGDGLGVAIADFIRSGSSTLKTWYIAGNRLTATGLTPLCEVLGTDQQVQQLWLKRNPIRSEGATPIASMLCTNTHLQVLDLTNTALLDEGVVKVMAALQQNENSVLQYLYLDSNGIGIPGTRAVASYLHMRSTATPVAATKAGDHCRALVGLSMGSNRLGDEGAAILADALMPLGLGSTHPLKRLSLPSCGIGAQGAVALAGMLAINTELRFLDLGIMMSTVALSEVPNRISDKGAQAIATALSQNTALRSLDIKHNNISQLGVAAVTDALQSNARSVLYDLHFQQYGIPISNIVVDELRFHLKAKQSALESAAKEFKMETQWLRPLHLEEIASVYRVGNIYDPPAAGGAIPAGPAVAT